MIWLNSSAPAAVLRSQSMVLDRLRHRQNPQNPLPDPTQPAIGSGFGSNCLTRTRVMGFDIEPADPTGTHAGYKQCKHWGMMY
jgi:hypothetical protein